MFKHFCFSLAASLIFLLGIQSPSLTNPTFQSKPQLMQYVRSLPGKSEHRLLIAQHCGWHNAENNGFDALVQRLHQQTGKYPAIVSIDYGIAPKDPQATPDLNVVNNTLISWAKSGGLVGVSCHSHNLVTGGTVWDRQPIPITQCLQPGTSLNQKWMSELDRIASGLQQLRDNGVIVIFRPLHEMNGNWFWWGGKSQQEYIALWRHMHRYFRREKGLDNLIWVYAAASGVSASPTGGQVKPVDYYYPGDDYCDMVGFDCYSDQGQIPPAVYQSLLKFNKPIALCECGPSLHRTPFRNSYNSQLFIDTIRQQCPNIVYALFWSAEDALVNNPGAEKVLNDPLVITKDDL